MGRGWPAGRLYAAFRSSTASALGDSGALCSGGAAGACACCTGAAGASCTGATGTMGVGAICGGTAAYGAASSATPSSPTLPAISALRRRISSMRSMALRLDADMISVSGSCVSVVSAPISPGVKVMRV